MVNITEDYCDFETSKLLKEKGFNEPCFAYYSEFIDDWRTLKLWKRYPKTYDTVKNDGYILVPTHQMAMKYLREFHNIVIMIEPHVYDYVNGKHKSYICSLFMGDNIYEYLGSRDYPSYEEAVEAAINYSLENLI